jgi:ATP-binding protein involved in chromosome partitioning
MTLIAPETIDAIFSRIPGNQEGMDLVRLGWIKGLVIQQDQVGFVLDVPQDQAQRLPELQKNVETALAQAYPTLKVRIVTTTHTVAKAPKKNQSPASNPILLPSILRVLAIASGKGGVGKSTLALGLARALRDQGQRVGLLDLDIFGPSLPTLLGALPPPPLNDQKKMMPHTVENMTVQSIGYMVDPEKAIIWRGPMVMGAVEQLFRDTAWPELDTLVLDLPPGTGDVALTLAQKIPLSGAIIITTPHDLSRADARRGVAMFQKMQVPILGIIENMAFFVCPSCDVHHDVFPQNTASPMDLPVLARLPLDPTGQALGPLLAGVVKLWVGN